MLLVYGVIAAVILSLCTGGRPRHYLAHPLRGIGLPIAAFALEALAPWAAKAISVPVWNWLWLPVCGQYLLLLAFCLMNIKRWPVWLVLLATLMNFAVISLNGFRMPVSPEALQMPALAETVARIQSGELFEYVIGNRSTPLLWLGDVIALPFIPTGLASLGDLSLAAGVGGLVFQSMRPVREKAE